MQYLSYLLFYFCIGEYINDITETNFFRIQIMKIEKFFVAVEVYYIIEIFKNRLNNNNNCCVY